MVVFKYFAQMCQFSKELINLIKMDQYDDEVYVLIDEFSVRSSLGEGYYASVKLCEKEGSSFAAKMFNRDTAQDDLEKEAKFISTLNHPNIIKAVDVRQGGMCTNQDGKQRKAQILILEYAEKGDLYNTIEKKRGLPEAFCRTYFLQLLSALKYLHSKNICHLDIKPQNILLDKEYKLKLADFGCAMHLNENLLKGREGTEEYMAPEILSGCTYDGEMADVFSAGMVLFLMHAGCLPFRKASPKDQLFWAMSSKMYNLFWGRHNLNRPEGFFNDSFKDLINKMLQAKPKDRLSLEMIEQHPWVKGEILEPSELKDAMDKLMKNDN